MKKIITILTIMIFMIGINNTSIKAEPKENKEKFYITNTYVNNSDSTIVEFNDGSTTVCNYENNLYEFYHVDLGDWGLKVNNKQELINVLKTYMENKYKMNEKEINNSDIFKNKNLVSDEEIKENNKKHEQIKVVEKDVNKNTKKENQNTEVKKESQKQTNTYEKIENENKLNHQVKSLNDFKNQFSKFGVVNSNQSSNKYNITLSDGLEIIYLIDIDMFYVYNINGNIKEFECMNDTKDYLNSLNSQDTKIIEVPEVEDVENDLQIDNEEIENIDNESTLENENNLIDNTAIQDTNLNNENINEVITCE